MHFLITAGPTREPLDPVRYLSNRSSGKMGYALAVAAAAAGHAVTLVSGPTALDAPAGVKLVKVTTAQEMFDAVQQVLPGVQVAIFAAAVADYRPVHASAQKIKKQEQTITITLERTPDILGSVRSSGFQGLLVGFAAETENLEANAKGKLTRKGCDFIVANDVSGGETGFDTNENEITVFFANGDARSLPRARKADLAQIIVGICGERMVTSRT